MVEPTSGVSVKRINKTTVKMIYRKDEVTVVKTVKIEGDKVIPIKDEGGKNG